MRADLIISADWHIREDQPVCRVDNFIKAQTKKWAFIKWLQEEHECPIIVAGDIFNHWKPSPKLLSWAFENIPDYVIAIPGNHDLPAHNLANIDKSGIHTLASGGKIDLLTKGHGIRKKITTPNGFEIEIFGFPFGTPLRNIKTSNSYQIAVIHSFVYQGKESFPGAALVGDTASSLCKSLNGFDLIITGDNHQTITAQVKDTILVNAGSITRTTASQTKHKPCVFLWYAETHTIEQVFLPIEEDVISREHIEAEEQKKERTSVFIQRLSEDIEISNSFKHNMKMYLSKNKVSKDIKNLIWEACEHG